MRLLLLLLLLMGSFMPTSLYLRGHSAQFTIECPPQTPTLPHHTHTHTHPLKYRFSSWHKQRGATRTAVKKKVKWEQGQRHSNMFPLFTMSVYWYFYLSALAAAADVVIPLVVVVYARIGPDSMFLTFTIATCFSNFQMRSWNAREPVRVEFKCLQCLPTGAWMAVLYDYYTGLACTI